MTRVYYKEAVGAFVVFDVTRTATFDAVSKWKQDLDSKVKYLYKYTNDLFIKRFSSLKVQLPDGNPIPCVLLANKVTLMNFFHLIN
jgi:Ras-related protein Rab-32